VLRQHVLARLTRHAALLAALALAGALPSATARAQVAPRDTTGGGDSVAITLGDAIGRAVGQSQEVRLARAQVDLARAQVTSARAAALPQINGGLNYTRTFASQFQSGGFTIPDSLRFEPDPTGTVEERLRYLEDNAANAGLSGLGALFGNLPFGQKNTWSATVTGTQPLFAGCRAPHRRALP
jgi:hypothetical protein